MWYHVGMTNRLPVQLLALLMLLLAGCDSPAPPRPADMTVVHHQFQIFPPAVTIAVNGASGLQQFEAWMDAQDVTDRATWKLDDKAVGIISRGLFSTNYPPPPEGDYIVSAIFRMDGVDYRAEAVATIIVPH